MSQGARESSKPSQLKIREMVGFVLMSLSKDITVEGGFVSRESKIINVSSEQSNSLTGFYNPEGRILLIGFEKNAREAWRSTQQYGSYGSSMKTRQCRYNRLKHELILIEDFATTERGA
jgi:hypothetical protein